MYHLEKYSGVQSRHICPNCNDKHSFAYYVDDDGNIVDESVGRCNHESSCGYHLTPKQYFDMHPELQSNNNFQRFNTTKHTHKPKKTDYIPLEYVSKSRCDKNTFVDFLNSTFNQTSVHQVCELYKIGSTKDKRVIFWQIDRFGQVRTGKIIKYNPITGHRVKNEIGSINWVHSLLKKRNLLQDDWNLTQCMFGEHLISQNGNADKTIALVEAEKTAIIGAIVFPQYIWIATGGIENLTPERFTALTGRTILIFPDIDGYDKWSNKAKSITNCKIIVSDIFKTDIVTDEDRKNKIDIADWIVADAIRKNKNIVNACNNDDMCKKMIDKNKNLLMLIKILNLNFKASHVDNIKPNNNY